MLSFKANQKHPVKIVVNGVTRTGLVEPRMHLADFLRHELQLFGTHVGCEHGICGACTVLVDGEPTRACLIYAVQVDGCCVSTVESLAKQGNLSVLQHFFSRHGALQCGFCTAGILMSTQRYLEICPQPTEEQVRDMLSGHICRCTGYQSIVDAILDYAATRQNCSAEETGIC